MMTDKDGHAVIVSTNHEPFGLSFCGSHVVGEISREDAEHLRIFLPRLARLMHAVIHLPRRGGGCGDDEEEGGGYGDDNVQ